MSKIISEQIEKTHLLVNGLRSKQELVRNKGLDQEFVDKLNTDNELLSVYNSELDKLKAELKAKTIQTNRKLMEIKTRIREAKKVVKRDFIQPQWKDFGITDKR